MSVSIKAERYLKTQINLDKETFEEENNCGKPANELTTIFVNTINDKQFVIVVKIILCLPSLVTAPEPDENIEKFFVDKRKEVKNMRNSSLMEQ